MANRLSKYLVRVDFKQDGRQAARIYARCPGCGDVHGFLIEGSEIWKWNGDAERPTFSPSMLSVLEYGDGRKPQRCHSYLTDGTWKFLNDSTHEHAGESMPAVELSEFNGV